MKLSHEGAIVDYPELAPPPPRPSRLGAKVSPEQLSEARKHVELIEQLLKSHGWQLFERALGERLKTVHAALIASPDPHSSAKAVGEFKALTEAREWPVKHRDHLMNFLKAWDPT